MIKISKVISTIINLENNTKAALNQIVSDVSKTVKQLEDVKKTLSAQKEALNNANIALNKAKEHYNSLSKEVLNNSKSYRDAIKNIENLKDKNASIIQTIREHQNIVENLKSEYGESNAAYQEAKKQLQQLETEQRKNLRSIKEQTKALDTLKNDVLNSNDAIREAKNQLKQYEDTVEQAEKSVKETAKELSKLSKEVKDNEKNFKDAKSSVKSWGKSLISSIDGALVKLAKFSLASASIAGGFAIKTGFETSFNLEAYRTQLQTAVKDTEKTTRLMQMATNLSNATPFTAQETIQSTSMLETYSIDSTKWLSAVADMAGATNKDMEQATGALIDAISKQEFQGIEEFGISKEMLMEIAKSNDKYKNLNIFKKSGEIQNKEAYEQLLMEVMNSKFGGGAEKLSQTVKGLWSTVTGITQTSLAKVFGMENGLIKTGSVLDLVKTKLQLLAETLTKWQNDGTLDEMANKFTETFNRILEVISNVYNYIKENKDTILSFLQIAGVIYMSAKAFIFLSETIKAVRIVMTLLNATLLASPLGIVVAIIGMIIASLAALQNPEAIAFLKTLGNVIFGTFKVVLGVVLEVIKGIGDIFSAINKGWKFVKGLFSDEEAEKTVKVKEKIETDKKDLDDLNTIDTSFNLPTENFSIPYSPIQDISNLKNENIASVPYVYPAGLLKENTKGIIKESTIQKEKTINTVQNSNPIQNITKNFNISINGDIYGIEDFEEKVAGVFVKVYETDMQNAV